MKKDQIQYEDYLAITAIVFEWADSYDNKDWNRLRKVLAPTMMVDYTIVGHGCFPEMPAEEFVEMMSSPKFLGDPLVHTQHLMGAAKYEKLSETEVIGHHQIRAAHQRYTSKHQIIVEERGHGHSYVKHWYKKIDGCWRLAGVCPRVYWNEHNFDKIFPLLSAAH